MDLEQTPDTTPESAPEAPAADDGMSASSSTERTEASLPEEYRPYSQFPWQDMPDELREPVLKSLKKFHGDMSRGQQEAAELRRRVPELSQKAEVLDRLAGDPEFLRWYNARFYGQGATTSQGQAAAAAPDRLSETIGQDGVAQLSSLIRTEIQRYVAPLGQQVEQVNRATHAERAQRALTDLTNLARQKGWPDPTGLLSQMTEAVQRGRATTVEDAYHLVAKEDILEAEVKKALNGQRQRLEGKAAATFAPYQGPSQAPTEELFTGRDATVRALQAAKRELQQQGVKF